jgi:hypothetical protein
MKVTGFTIIRNAIKYDYPVVEAIRSVLPVCDEFLVSVGNSEDGTLDLIRSIDSPKIRIMESVWDDRLREGGKLLSIETNKAFDAIDASTDWCFYIQSDEVLHEKYHEHVRMAMERYKDDTFVDGLLFNYVHFYGSYKYVGNSVRWYRKEIRIIRNDKTIRSYKDAQGFRKTNNSKLKVKAIDASIYHYGWVKPPKAQQAKQESFHKMWHDDEWMKKNIEAAQEFDYSKIDSLELFKDTHPSVMKERVSKQDWDFQYDPSKIKISIKDKIKMLIEKQTGWLPGEYKNYELI